MLSKNRRGGLLMDCLLKGATVVDPAENRNGRADILIRRGLIAEVGREIVLPPGDAVPVLDVTGLHAVPGLIDIHVHFRDPGFTHKETLETGAAAAVAGGFTSVVCMPNTDPVLDEPEVLADLLSRGAAQGCRIYAMGAITLGQRGREVCSLGELKAAGAVGVTDDGKSVAHAGVMFEALKKARVHGLTVSSHCEEPSLTFDRSINAGDTAAHLGLQGVPALAEELIIQRDLLLAEAAGARLHIQHISTARGVEMVRQAKARGVKVTAEAAPHHFCLTEEAVIFCGTNARMSPPLRTEKDREAVCRGLSDGTIDAIATDHAPHTAEEKGTDLAAGANGIVGLETALGLGLKYLVKPGYLSFSGLVNRMSAAPAALLGLPGGSLRRGQPADITLIDLDREWTVDPSSFRSRGRNTPFEGEMLKGQAVLTLVGGELRSCADPEQGTPPVDRWWDRAAGV
jgi:dihydroorotase